MAVPSVPTGSHQLTGDTSRAADRRKAPRRRRSVGAAALITLAALLVASAALAAAIGSVRLPYIETLWVIVAKSLRLPVALDPTHEAIIWSVRLPRVAAAGLVGFGLAVSGAAMQGLFKNPLATPGITGLSSGASLGAALAIFWGWQFIHPWLVPLAAFAGALLAVVIVYALSTRSGKTDTATLLLAGLAVSAFFDAVLSAVYHFVDAGVLREIVYWLMGNLGGKSWQHVVTVTPLILLGSLGLYAFAPDLNALVTGEDQARSVGVAVQRTKRAVLALVSLVTGAAISVAGLIGFVGLIVPHTMRFIVGPDHRWLLPASGLAGAAFLILCDLIARAAFSPIELRTGIVTAFFGVPFFLGILIKRWESVRWD